MNQSDILFLDVHQLLEKDNLADAYQILYDIVSLDPGHGRAHNYLGWIYETKFKNFEKAKNHYQMAIKFCNNDYPVAYTNYIYLLIDYSQFDEALMMIEEAKKVNGMDFSVLYYQKGKIMEVKMKFKKAYFYYRSAKLKTTNSEFVHMMNIEIERINNKVNWFNRMVLTFYS